MQLLLRKIFDMFIKLLKPLCSTSRATRNALEYHASVTILYTTYLLTLNVRIGNLRINAISFPHLLCGHILIKYKPA